MKKTAKIISAFLLAFCILLSPVSAFAANTDSGSSAIVGASKAINTIINGAFTAASWLFPKADYMTADEYSVSGSKNFFEGTAVFLDEPAENAKWSLGFGKSSIVPENLTDGSKEYYTGGYFTQKINSVYDDQGVNAIALNDGSGRGTAIFAAIDGIGVGNADIRSIRATVEKKLNDKDIESDIIAININSTHCHTVIDTQGFNLDLIPKIFNNIFSWLPFVETKRSIDEDFIEVMIDGASDAIVEAYLNMTEGKLYYFETTGIGREDDKKLYPDDEYSYLTNKRYGEGYQHVIACFKFIPDNRDIAPTVFANLGAHPTTIDRKTQLLSADFPHYIEKSINEIGMNFMFLQGAQSPISVKKNNVKNQSVLDKVAAEAENDPNAADYQSAKSLGYEFARLILEASADAEEIEPMLNIDMDECTVKLDKGLFYLAADAQMLGFTTVFDSESPSGYSLITEVGYIEIGKNITMLTVPGELIPQLVYGNVISAEDSYLGTDWEFEATADIIKKENPDETVLVMGLCNDAIGYIIPDNDYAPFIADSLWGMEIGDFKLGEELFGEYRRHYEELLSAGGSAASSVIGSVNAVAERRIDK
ncbi:MAG: hypothetical protein IJE74_03740 [Clostridia bacterium]|nr:hypothetical protein [Clostridia bacterium]